MARVGGGSYTFTHESLRLACPQPCPHRDAQPVQEMTNDHVLTELHFMLLFLHFSLTER